MINLTEIRLGVYVALVVCATACHGLLDVSDPTLIQDDALQNPSGANTQRQLASFNFNSNIVTLSRGIAMVTDEWAFDAPAFYDYSASDLALLDRRESQRFEAAFTSQGYLGPPTQTVTATSMAIPFVRAYSPESVRSDYLAQLYAIRGYMILEMAEDLCPGFPIDDIVDRQAVFGGPLTTDSVLAVASTTLDSALKYVKDTARFATLARVTKARVLLEQGKYDEAAAMANLVGSSPSYTTEEDAAYDMAMSPGCTTGCLNVVLGDREGGNGLPFVSAHDPRINTLVSTPRNTDSTDTLYYTDKYNNGASMVLASGLEARLIQAEAELHGNNDHWVTIVDSLRATIGLDVVAV